MYKVSRRKGTAAHKHLIFWYFSPQSPEQLRAEHGTQTVVTLSEKQGPQGQVSHIRRNPLSDQFLQGASFLLATGSSVFFYIKCVSQFWAYKWGVQLQILSENLKRMGYFRKSICRHLTAGAARSGWYAPHTAQPAFWHIPNDCPLFCQKPWHLLPQALFLRVLGGCSRMGSSRVPLHPSNPALQGLSPHPPHVHQAQSPRVNVTRLISGWLS